ncbi:hypothetical protein N8I77_013639 [Diaporthe amygdali]|uniref:Uncharacterized protein n=1 Tax=Phomopsis amygdali TaxID=1214568 RepID=A0AAD9S0S6_PHOAM|nr:hypothetical protein N8I77_013639 [Diaporthe amygdali]
MELIHQNNTANASPTPEPVSMCSQQVTIYPLVGLPQLVDIDSMHVGNAPACLAALDLVSVAARPTCQDEEEVQQRHQLRAPVLLHGVLGPPLIQVVACGLVIEKGLCRLGLVVGRRGVGVASLDVDVFEV